MRTQFLNQTTGGMGPPRVFSTYTYTAVIMFFKNCEFGEYASVASAYVKDSGTLDSSNNYLRMEPQTIRLRLVLVSENATMPLEEILERL